MKTHLTLHNMYSDILVNVSIKFIVPHNGWCEKNKITLWGRLKLLYIYMCNHQSLLPTLCGLTYDLVIWKFRKRIVIHDTEYPYWDHMKTHFDLHNVHSHILVNVTMKCYHENPFKFAYWSGPRSMCDKYYCVSFGRIPHAMWTKHVIIYECYNIYFSSIILRNFPYITLKTHCPTLYLTS